MVRTEGIKKHFSDPKKGLVKAVDGVDIAASPGQIFGLLGVNGAGKTTLLRMLSTVLTPTAGRAEVAGFDVALQPEKVRASIGFMSTSTALYGRLTAKEMIVYFGQLYGLQGGRLRERLEFVREQLQMDEFFDRLCDKLSTGQKQRVSIARTILHDPPVLFFDEPTAGLDVVTSQTVMGFIEGARDQGKTVIFSTHIMSEVERLCDHVAIIHNGLIRGEGTVDQLKEQAGETNTAALVEVVDARTMVVSYGTDLVIPAGPVTNRAVEYGSGAATSSGVRPVPLTILYVEGMDTSGQAHGRRVPMPGNYCITGTRKYIRPDTLATRQVFTVEPVPAASK